MNELYCNKLVSSYEGTHPKSILSELCKEKHCHCLCLQETHRAKDEARPSIPGVALVAEQCPQSLTLLTCHYATL